MIKKKRALILPVLVLVLSISLITAAGIARPYWNANPLKLAPGESKIVQLTLQNTEPSDMTFTAAIEGGNEIAILDDKSNEYFVPSGETNKLVSIKVEVPEDAEIGTIYKVIASFKQIASGEGGMIKMTGAFTTNFPVEVVGEQESEIYGEPKGIPTSTIIMIVALVLIAFLIVINAYRKKKK